MSFKSKGPYIAFNISRACLGAYDRLADAKRACANDETAPMGKWKAVTDSFGSAYYADSGCEIFVGFDHPHVKLTREEIDKAGERYRWRESLR